MAIGADATDFGFDSDGVPRIVVASA